MSIFVRKSLFIVSVTKIMMFYYYIQNAEITKSTQIKGGCEQFDPAYAPMNQKEDSKETSSLSEHQ